MLTKPFAKPAGANDQIRVAVVGLRSKGKQHVRIFKELVDARVVALCDVDENILNQAAVEFTNQNLEVETYTDFSRLLENKQIDAVVLSTPNHWHSLQAIWACQAGKDVYVEKPISHNIFEGRMLVNAARKYKSIVQAGTQSRSDEALQQVFDYIQKGNMGKIKAVHGLCYKPRKSIGKVAGPQPIPDKVDYNLWTGPAPLHPLRRERLHYDWHWVWETGNGDIGNQGVHEMDMCRWVLGEDQFPKTVTSFGGRFGYDDDGETPNTQVAVFEYDDAPLIFEVQGLPQKKGIEAMNHYHGVRIGLIVKCENGYFAGGSGGGWIYDNNNQRIKQFTSSGGGGHQQNFIKAVQSRNPSDLNADILECHLSSSLCHLANISYRMGTETLPEEISKSISHLPAAKETFNRFQDHLFANWIDLTKNKLKLGPKLDIDVRNERFAQNESYDLAFWANQLIKDNYRQPFVLPQKI
jgi:predicted dehydrogenase